MSTCISRHGEWSDHALATSGNAEDRFQCSRCLVLDEGALLNALEVTEAGLAEAKRIRDQYRRRLKESGQRNLDLDTENQRLREGVAALIPDYDDIPLLEARLHALLETVTDAE